MARFYGTITGNRNTTVTKSGNKQTGMYAHIRGWNIGASINLYVDDKDNDIMEIEITGGSNNDTRKRYLGKYKLNKKGEPVKMKRSFPVYEKK